MWVASLAAASCQARYQQKIYANCCRVPIYRARAVRSQENMYRLLALDLDGTLLTPQKLITPRTRDLLCQAEEVNKEVNISGERAK